jgi:hypothetical protein
VTALVPSETACLASSPGRTRRQPWQGGRKKPRRRGERRGSEDLPPGRSHVCRRRYAGVEASSGSVLRRSRAAAASFPLNPRVPPRGLRTAWKGGDRRGFGGVGPWKPRVPNGPSGFCELQEVFAGTRRLVSCAA